MLGWALSAFALMLVSVPRLRRLPPQCAKLRAQHRCTRRQVLALDRPLLAAMASGLWGSRNASPGKTGDDGAALRYSFAQITGSPATCRSLLPNSGSN